jgi:nucleotide-binding universal stress UspA family protein
MDAVERVLAATDGSEHGLSAVVTSANCARRTGASLNVVAVAESVLSPIGVDLALYEETFADQLREQVEAQLAEAEVADASLHLEVGFAAPVITQIAEDVDADLIVVGAHPRPAVARFLVGSTAERVIRMAHRPVLVATEQRREPFRRVLAAVDLSGQSHRVVESAVAAAVACGSELRALYVQDRLTPILVEEALYDEEETRHQSGAQLRKTLEAVAVPSELMVSQEIRDGHAGQEILRAADDWDADLIVMGSHGFGFFNRLLLGSISTHVLRHGHRATLVVPRAE